MMGAGMSALFYKLPSGAMIVLVCTLFFLISTVFGSARGVLIRFVRRSRLDRAVDRQHLLRAVYEILESSGQLDHGQHREQPDGSGAVSIRDLLSKRSWSIGRLHREIRRAQRAKLVERTADQIRLSKQGMDEASRLTRQHRLWELYLITHADIAPSRVDRDADAIEHVLEPDVVAQLESLLERTRAGVPASPHELPSPHGDSIPVPSCEP
jgi:manganese/zinc/iron transport system permease protein